MADGFFLKPETAQRLMKMLTEYERNGGFQPRSTFRVPPQRAIPSVGGNVSLYRMLANGNGILQKWDSGTNDLDDANATEVTITSNRSDGDFFPDDIVEVVTVGGQKFLFHGPRKFLIGELTEDLETLSTADVDVYNNIGASIGITKEINDIIGITDTIPTGTLVFADFMNGIWVYKNSVCSA